MTDLPTPLSGRNPRISTLRRLIGRRSARREAGLFVLEGHTLVAEALAAAGAGGPKVSEVYVDADASDLSGLATDVARAGAELVVLDPGGIARVASTATPQPVLAVAAIPAVPFEALADDLDLDALVVVLVDVGDPGNVGTLVRSARAAGARALVVTGTTADVWSPKTVRASAGAVLALPIVEGTDPTSALDALRNLGVRRLGAVVAGGVAPEDALLGTGRVALVLGSEAHGLDADTLGQLDGTVTIPMPGSMESLNVAMAGTVLLFEAARQRRAAS